MSEPLPAEIESARLRLRAFLHEDLLPAERAQGVREEADAPPALRRWVRARAEERGVFRLLQPADLGRGGLGPLGQAALDGGLHGEFELAGAPVPREDVLGEIGQGLPRALESITALRLRAAAQARGTGRWALGYTLRQATRPHRSGTPLAEREQVQAMIADSAMDLFAARAALYAAARLAEDGAPVEVEVAMAKTLASDAVARIVDRAMQLTGGAAVVEGHPLAQLYRQVRAWRIAEGTTEVLRLVIARGLLERERAQAPPDDSAAHA